MPGAKPTKCPKLLAIFSYSLSGWSPVSKVVNPLAKPLPNCITASPKLKSPG